MDAWDGWMLGWMGASGNEWVDDLMLVLVTQNLLREEMAGRGEGDGPLR